MVTVLGYKREEVTRGFIMRGFTVCFFNKHRYCYCDTLKEHERGGTCSTRDTRKMHADVTSESLNEIGLMPDRCTYERIILKWSIKEQVGLWIRSTRLELGPKVNYCKHGYISSLVGTP
jgi:hypothetical protein